MYYNLNYNLISKQTLLDKQQGLFFFIKKEEQCMKKEETNQFLEKDYFNDLQKIKKQLK